MDNNSLAKLARGIAINMSNFCRACLCGRWGKFCFSKKSSYNLQDCFNWLSKIDYDYYHIRQILLSLVPWAVTINYYCSAFTFLALCNFCLFMTHLCLISGHFCKGLTPSVSHIFCMRRAYIDSLSQYFRRLLPVSRRPLSGWKNPNRNTGPRSLKCTSSLC